MVRRALKGYLEKDQQERARSQTIHNAVLDESFFFGFDAIGSRLESGCR